MKPDRTTRLITSAIGKSWDSVVEHPLQSWSWGEFRRSMHVDVVRIGVYSRDTLTGGWQLTFHAIPHTPWTVGYFPKGPLPDAFMVEELKKIGRTKNAISIQLEPDSTETQIPPSLIAAHRPLFTKYTFTLDISKSEEQLLTAMHPKTRYNIRLAQKRGVTIQEDNSEEAFQAYLSLSEETTKRQGFYAHNTAYHTSMWKILHPAGIARLFTARYNNTILAAWIIFVWEKTIYYPYGASSRLHREVMAPNLLLWEIVRWAKKQHFTRFDLWGALGRNPDTHDPWYGFHRFKEGYSPEFIEFTGSYDLVLKPMAYTLFTIADSVRWTVLRLKK